MSLPIVSNGEEYYDFNPQDGEGVPPDADDLPPHRAAIPVPLTLIQHRAAIRRNNRLWLGIVFSLALHGGFLAGAMIWGQGGTLPNGANRHPVALRVEIAQAERGYEQDAAAKQALLSETAGLTEQSGDAVIEPDTASTDPDAPDARQTSADADTAESAAPEQPARPATVAQAEPSAGPDAMAITRAEPSAADLQAQRNPEAVTAAPSAVLDIRTELIAETAPTANRAEQEPAADKARAGYLPPALARADAAKSGEIGEVPPMPERAGTAILTAMLWEGSDSRLRGTRHAAPSRGAVFGYKRRVRARVMARLPRGSWTSGRVVIGFRLSQSGALLASSVLRSSGNPAIDRVALNCVRTADPYPPPPLGALPSQLALSVDFRFE